MLPVDNCEKFQLFEEKINYALHSIFNLVGKLKNKTKK